MTRYKSLLLTCFALMISLSPLQASVDEVSVEEFYTHLTQKTLDTIYGSGVFITKINVTLSQPRYEVKYTNESNAKRNKNQKTEKVSILPGYPVIRNLSPQNPNQLPFDSLTTYIRPRITNLSASIITNREFPRSQLNRVRKTISEVLPIKSPEQDITFTIKRFSQPEKTSLFSPQTSQSQTPRLLTIQNGFYAALLILIAMMIALYVIYQNRQLKMMARTAQKKPETGGGSSDISITPHFDSPTRPQGPSNLKLSQAPPIKQYFEFVTEENVDKLIYILKKEIDKIGIENLSILIASLDPSVASKVIQSLDIKYQAPVSVKMVKQKIINKTLIDKFESQIKAAMESQIGGPFIFKSIYALASNSSKRKLLNALKQSSAEGYTQVRQHLLLFDDIILLDNEELSEVISEAGIDTVARAMINLDPAIVTKIEETLTKSARDLIRQFLELKGPSIPPEEIENAQNQILQLIQQMESDGKLNLTQKLKT